MRQWLMGWWERLTEAWEQLVYPGSVRRDVTTNVIANLIVAAIFYLIAVAYEYIPPERVLVLVAIGWLAGAVLGPVISRGVATRGARLRCAGGRVPDVVGRAMPVLSIIALATVIGVAAYDAIIETLPTFVIAIPAALVILTYPASHSYSRQLSSVRTADDADIDVPRT